MKETKCDVCSGTIGSSYKIANSFHLNRHQTASIADCFSNGITAWKKLKLIYLFFIALNPTCSYHSQITSLN